MARSIIIGAGSYDNDDFGSLQSATIAKPATYATEAFRMGADATLISIYAQTSSATGTGRTIRAAVNGSASALAINLANTAYAAGEATASPQSLVAGNTVAYNALLTTGTISVTTRATFNSVSGGCVTPLQCNNVTGATISELNGAIAVAGALNVATYSAGVIAFREMTVRAAGVWQGLHLYVLTNSITGANTMTFAGMVNDVAGNQSITIGSGDPPGLYAYTGAGDSVAAGQRIYVKQTRSGTASIAATTLGSVIVSNNKSSDIFGFGARSMSAASFPVHLRLADGDPGASNPASTAQARGVTLGFPARLSRLRIGCGASTLDQAAVWTLHVDGSPTALTVSQAAGAAAGLVEDSVNTVTVTANQVLTLVGTSTATTGNFSHQSRGITIEDLTAVEITASLFASARVEALAKSDRVATAYLRGSGRVAASATRAVAIASALRGGARIAQSLSVFIPISAALRGAARLGAVFGRTREIVSALVGAGRAQGAAGRVLSVSGDMRGGAGVRAPMSGILSASAALGGGACLAASAQGSIKVASSLRIGSRLLSTLTSETGAAAIRSIYDPVAARVLALITRKGAAVVFVREGGAGARDPVTQQAPEAGPPERFTRRAVATPPGRTWAEQIGTNSAQNFMELHVAPQEFTPVADDRVEWAGLTWRVIDFAEYKPDGIRAVYTRVLVRR
jgi:hypothetical protein